MSESRDWIRKTLEYTDIALVSFDDEGMLFGDRSVQETEQRLRGYGVKEVVVKNGMNSCLVSCAGMHQEVLPETVKKQIDTTAAGDSFNAAYIAARMQGLSISQAAQKGHQLAAKVIQYPGGNYSGGSMLSAKQNGLHLNYIGLYLNYVKLILIKQFWRQLVL